MTATLPETPSAVRQEAERLLAETEQWAQAQPDWGVRRYEIDGLPRLLVHTPAGRFMLSPGDGIATYYKIPSLTSEHLYFDQGRWEFAEGSDDPNAGALMVPWTKEKFLEATARLEEAA
ncbi:MAG: hypothetical protein AAF907_12435 [Planctomycetota bacterium]